MFKKYKKNLDTQCSFCYIIQLVFEPNLWKVFRGRIKTCQNVNDSDCLLTLIIFDFILYFPRWRLVIKFKTNVTLNFYASQWSSSKTSTLMFKEEINLIFFQISSSFHNRLSMTKLFFSTSLWLDLQIM